MNEDFSELINHDIKNNYNTPRTKLRYMNADKTSTIKNIIESLKNKIP